MRHAVEFRAEVRRLRDAFRRTDSPRKRIAINSENPDIRSDVRSMLAKGIPDEPRSHIIEKLLKYMEKNSAAIATNPDSHDRHDGLEALANPDEKRLDVVARELIRGHGLQTISYLRELAEIANGAGDQLSADAWRDLADAAERIIQIWSRESNG